MYYYVFPKEQYEINERAKAVKELYPEITIEFGYDHEVLTTCVGYIHERVMFTHTHENFRRQGMMSLHLQSLVKRGVIKEAIAAVNNLEGQILLAKNGFVPSHFITPMVKSGGWNTTKHIVYVHAEPNTRELAIQRSVNPFASAFKSWVEESIVIEQIPTPL